MYNCASILQRWISGLILPDRDVACCNGAGALAWTLHHPAVTAPIIGPRTIDQLTGSLRTLEIKLEEVAMKTLNEIWPGA